MGNSKRAKKNKTGASERSRGKILAMLCLKAAAGLTILGALGALSTYVYFSRNLPPIDSLKNYEPPQITRVYDRTGQLIGEIFTERRTLVSMSDIPRHVVLAILAAEDSGFYEHEGLAYKGILRAVFTDLIAGHVKQGGSTITQQVVKLGLLTPEQTISRKIRELILARKLENTLSKDEILHLYLNHVNFGHGRYGIQEAAQYYYDKDVSELTLAEAALLAGLPQAPTRLSPRRHLQTALKRQQYVLSQLSEKRELYWPDLSESEIEAARTEDVTPRPLRKNTGKAPEIMAIARRTLRELEGKKALKQGGYEIYTTIDLDLQEQARNALQHGLTEIDKRQERQGPVSRKQQKLEPSAKTDSLSMGRPYIATVTDADNDSEQIDLDVAGHPAVLPMKHVARYNPEHYTASEFAKPGDLLPVSIQQMATTTKPAILRLERGPEGAVVVIDPRSRGIIILVGGYQKSSGFNRATHALRQPGSAFKPIIYAKAIQTRHFTPASTVVDAPAVYNEWKPQNYERWHYRGAVRLRQALAKSINMVAIRVLENIGTRQVARFARDLGFTSKLEENMALALGASSVTPLELTNAYATFAAGGHWAPTHVIDKIVAPNGEELSLPPHEPERDVMTPEEAYVITDMLQSVITEGTGSLARKLKMPLAGKTGTSNSVRDAWFVGYSPSLVTSVWIGFDDSRPIGKRENGARSALPIWVDVMKAANPSTQQANFAIPSGVRFAKIDPASGLLAYDGQLDAIPEVFLPGTSPTHVARSPEIADPGMFMMEQFETLTNATDDTSDNDFKPDGGDPASERALGEHAPP